MLIPQPAAPLRRVESISPYHGIRRPSCPAREGATQEPCGSALSCVSLEEHNLLVDPVTGRKRVFYSLRSTYATTVMNYDAVPIRDLSKQLGNSVGIIQKHYDRASGEAIVENIKAPNAKKALFDTSKVREIYKSNKVG